MSKAEGRLFELTKGENSVDSQLKTSFSMDKLDSSQLTTNSM